VFCSWAQQGNCDPFKKNVPFIFTISPDVKCWYGTSGPDIILVSQNKNVLINKNVAGEYGSGLNIFFGYEGADAISGGSNIDWIYGGPGADKITVNENTIVYGGGDGNTFYMSNPQDQAFIAKHIKDFVGKSTPPTKPADIQKPDHDEAHCPSPITVEYGESTDIFTRRYCPHWKTYKESDIYSNEFVLKHCPNCDPMRH
jgi:hypothetical protein